MSYRTHCYLTKFPYVGIEIQTANNSILLYKIFPTKNVGKKRGYVLQNPLLAYKISACGDRKIQYKQQKSALQNISHSQKKVEKKEGVCCTEFTVILQNFRMWGQKNTIKTIEFCVTKYFLFLQKKRGMLHRIHCYLTRFPHVGIEKYNSNNRILHYKVFPTKNVAKGGRVE